MYHISFGKLTALWNLLTLIVLL